jgi:hypothetical protein
MNFNDYSSGGGAYMEGAAISSAYRFSLRLTRSLYHLGIPWLLVDLLNSDMNTISLSEDKPKTLPQSLTKQGMEALAS